MSAACDRKEMEMIEFNLGEYEQSVKAVLRMCEALKHVVRNRATLNKIFRAVQAGDPNFEYEFNFHKLLYQAVLATRDGIQEPLAGRIKKLKKRLSLQRTLKRLNQYKAKSQKV